MNESRSLSTKRGTNMSVRCEVAGLSLKRRWILLSMHGSGETPVTSLGHGWSCVLHTVLCSRAALPPPALAICCKRSAAWMLVRGSSQRGLQLVAGDCSLSYERPGLVTVTLFTGSLSYWSRLNASSSVFLAAFNGVMESMARQSRTVDQINTRNAQIRWLMSRAPGRRA